MNNDGLSDKQEMALELAMSGMKDGEIAKRVGVSRQWVNKWRNQDTDFMYALQMRRQLMREKHMDSLSQLIEKSIEIVNEALEKGDEQTKLKAAMYVLKISGLQGYARPGKPMTKEEMEKETIISAIEQASREMGIIK